MISEKHVMSAKLLTNSLSPMRFTIDDREVFEAFFLTMYRHFIREKAQHIAYTFPSVP
jgi:hypothetical protein